MISLTSKNAKLKKKAQAIGRGFRRIDYSNEELNAKGREIDITQFFNSPNSIIDLVLDMNSVNFSSKEDENKIYEIWQKSEGAPNLTVDDFEGQKLMGRGYLASNNGKYEFTPKALKSLINIILSKKPSFDWETINKTAALQKRAHSIPLSSFSSYYELLNNDNGTVVSYRVPNDQMSQNALKNLPKDVVADIKLRSNSVYLIIPAAYIKKEDNQSVERDLEPSVDPYVNTDGPAPPEATYDLHTFTNSKLIGMFKCAKNKQVRNIIAKEAESRGLKVRFFATNEAEREKGLMHSEPLKDNECAVFIFTMHDHTNFDHAAKYMAPHKDLTRNPGFWNKNVSFPIDVGFYDKDGILVAIKQLEANQLEPVFSGHNGVRYVVETKKGWYEKNGLKQGSSIWQVVNGLPRM